MLVENGTGLCWFRIYLYVVWWDVDVTVGNREPGPGLFDLLLFRIKRRRDRDFESHRIHIHRQRPVHVVLRPRLRVDFQR